MNPPPSSPIALQQAMDWLAAAPQEDPLLDLIPLRSHLATLAAAELPVLQRLKPVKQLQQRADRIDATLTPLLLDARLPLPQHLGTIAQSLLVLRADFDQAWLRLAADADPRQLAGVHVSRKQICLYGLGNLWHQAIATLLIALPPATNFWRNAQSFYQQAQDAIDPAATLTETGAIENRFKAILALSVAQPEGLSAREIVFLADYLETQAALTRIDPTRPAVAGDWLWLDHRLDQPPTWLARLPPGGDRCLYLRFGELADQAARLIEQLHDGAPPLSLGLPPQAADPDYRNTLQRAQECWAAPRRRSFNRRPHALRVQVCTQLGSLWTALASEPPDEPSARDYELTFSDWMVVNESPSGYAVLHVVGEVSGIVPGCAVGLRTGVGAAWQICLVRWARCKSRSHIELGLEVMAPSAKPIRIQALAGADTAPPRPALLLPALPALDRREAILAVRGERQAGRFAMLQDNQTRLQVVECMPQRSLIETFSIEVFEFVRNTHGG